MRWVWLALLAWASPAAAVTCADTTFDGASYTVCAVDLGQDALKLFHSDPAGDVYGQFSAIEDDLGKALLFAMNAGMYHNDRRPVGLYVEDGVETARLVTSDGPGNFGLLPNGVFCLTRETAQVIESLRYARDQPDCRDATQSGPMLVIDGELHPRFIPNGSSKFIRNGVGTSADGRTAYFAISNEPVNFHSFGRLFRDHIGVDQALYFDGKVSRLHAPALGRSDFGWGLGPIVGVVDGGS